jgi:hypothetical protein
MTIVSLEIMVKFNKTDRVILAVSTLIVILYSYFLYDDSFLFNSESSSYKQIGVLSLSANDVRRKPVESFLWSPAKSQQTLHEKDSIFTGEKSKAEVLLNDGSVIKLEENSLVILSMREGDLELNLKYGEIQTELKNLAKLQIKSDKENLVIENDKKKNSKLKIKKSNLSPAKVDLIEGSLTMSSKSKPEKIVLKKDEGLNFHSSGEIKKASPGNIDLLTPDNTKITLITKKQGFFLNWKSHNIAQEQLFVSTDSNFETVLLKQDKISNKIFLNDLEGKLYWKIEGQDLQNKKISSKIHSVDIKVFKTPVITTPENNAQLTFQTKDDLKKWSTPVAIEWNSDFTTYEYQISNNEKFATLLDSKKTTENKIKLAAHIGTYFVRVRGTYNNIPAEWSPAVSFNVLATRSSEEPPNAPLLLTKKIKMEPPNSRAPAAIPAAVIKWKKVDKAFKYIVEVDSRNDFKSPLKFESKSDFSAFKPNSSLKYYFRVKSVSKSKLQSPYSEVGELNITVKKPILDKVESIIYRSSKVDEPAPPMEFSLTWTHVPLAKRYTVEYAESADFKDAIQILSTSNKSKVKVPKPGTYHFRVLASIEENKPITPPSNSESSIYNFKQKLPSPILSEPRNKMTVFLQQEIEPFIWLNWEKDQVATKYEFQISTDVKFKSLLITKTIEDNKFLIKEKLPLGKIYWRVRSLTEDDGLTSDWSAKREFILLHNKNNESFE